MGLALSKAEGSRRAYVRGLRTGEKQREAARRYELDEGVFERELTPATAWVLGVVVGDGCVVRYKGILQGLDLVGDRDVMEKSAKILASTSPVRMKGNYAQVRFCSPRLAGSLVSLGVCPDKAWTVPWPGRIPENLEGHFVRGLWDSDGCVTQARRKYLALSLKSCSDSLMREVLRRVQMVTGSTGRLVRPRDGCLLLQVTCANACRLGEWLWECSTPDIRGERKFARFVALTGKEVSDG